MGFLQVQPKAALISIEGLLLPAFLHPSEPA